MGKRGGLQHQVASAKPSNSDSSQSLIVKEQKQNQSHKYSQSSASDSDSCSDSGDTAPQAPISDAAVASSPPITKGEVSAVGDVLNKALNALSQELATSTGTQAPSQDDEKSTSHDDEKSTSHDAKEGEPSNNTGSVASPASTSKAMDDGPSSLTSEKKSAPETSAAPMASNCDAGFLGGLKRLLNFKSTNGGQDDTVDVKNVVAEVATGDANDKCAEDKSEDEKSTKKAQKLTKKKDVAQKCTKVSSAYNLFCKDVHAKIVEEQPELKFGAITKLKAERWKSLDAEAKQKYERAAEEARKAARQSERTEGTSEISLKKEKKVKKSGKPAKKEGSISNESQKLVTKPVNTDFSLDSFAFMEFCVKNRERVEKGLGEGATLADIQLELKKEWNDIHEDAKDFVSLAPAGPSVKVKFDAERITCGYADAEEGDLEAVVARSLDREYVTKLKRLAYTHLDYEEPPHKKARSGDQGLAAAISAFNSRHSQFLEEIRRRKGGKGELDLDDLEPGSLLEDVFPKPGTKLPNDDIWIRVPMLGLSFVVQNMIDCERAAKTAAVHELERVKARLCKLEKQVEE